MRPYYYRILVVLRKLPLPFVTFKETRIWMNSIYMFGEFVFIFKLRFTIRTGNLTISWHSRILCMSFAFKLIVVGYFIFTMEGLASKQYFKKLYRLQVIKWPWIRPFGLATWDHHLCLSSIRLSDHLACGTSLDVPCVFHYQFVVYIRHISSGITFATYRERVEF
jgi:hypothetical protein